MSNDPHFKCEHRKSLRADHATGCPVRTDGAENRACTCHYSDARCTEVAQAAPALPVKLEFLNAVGVPIKVTDFADLPIDSIRSLIDVFTFPFRSDVYAVRITAHGRVVLHRRPVMAYGPGHLPQISPNPIRLAQERRDGIPRQGNWRNGR